jgi:hypothetical protein
MASSVNQLVVASSCFARAVPQGDQWAVLIYLFNSIAGTGMTPEQLTVAAKCFSRSIPQGDMLAVLLYVSNQILLNGGTGGGGGAANYYANYGGGNPTPVPASGTPLAIDSSNGFGYVWNGSAWVRIF